MSKKNQPLIKRNARIALLIVKRENRQLKQKMMELTAAIELFSQVQIKEPMMLQKAV